ncbi:MAG: hemolysin III family protein [Peptoniphilus sp.]|uniref:PAQR family membrane homeostasis protein TrhA n=1 Tax=Peptoniphilus sp. TaxID=1971214 RepID=UPI002A755136|nr:hemolysin III family protein [Peptoniphilus sp.]MDY2986804.1 hemolysin III family protein [Peptoniphilus sp.]
MLKEGDFIKREVVTYSFKEQLLNAITHWLGFLLGIVGLVFLMIFGIRNHSVVQIVGFSIYGGCLIFLYLSSALYHSIPNEKFKRIFRVFDHCSIFIFIGGTYTPIILLSLSGIIRIVMLSFIWLICIGGIVFKIITLGKFSKFDKLSLGIYLGLGWISIFMIKSIYNTTSLEFIFCLVLGGLLYSIGAIFYANKKIPYNHAIWHVFVLLASVVHFVGILGAYALV